MSPRKPPPTLKNVCISLLSNRLIEVLSDDECIYLEKIISYMSLATYDTLQVLLNGILELINLDANTRYSCLQVLLRTDVKCLQIGIFPRFYYDKILVTITNKGSGLQYLNLKGVWAKDYPESINRVLENCRCLKSLIIPHMADDSVIRRVNKLDQLMELDISGEACYSIDGIRLLQIESLRILDIGSFGKPFLCHNSSQNHEVIADILLNLPNLNVLKTYSFTGHALLYLYKKDNNFKTKLTYLHTTDCDVEILDAINQTCPFLENCHMNCPKDGVVTRMKHLKRLHSLKLTKGDAAELKNFLQHSGHQLVSLKLNHIKTSVIDLSDICEFIPNLSNLECYQMYLKYSNKEVFYMNLKRVQISYCDIDDGVIRSLLTNAPFLRSVSVGCGLEMTDGDMFRLLGEYTLENLEEIIFSDARFLTSVTVQLLTENCSKLKILGSLTGWDVSEEEVDALKILLALSNTDLTFWPVS